MQHIDQWCRIDAYSDYGYTKQITKTGIMVDSTIAMPFCHQSAFSRRALHTEFPFDLRYRIAADFKSFPRKLKSTFLISLWKNEAVNPLKSSESKMVGTIS